MKRQSDLLMTERMLELADADIWYTESIDDVSNGALGVTLLDVVDSLLGDMVHLMSKSRNMAYISNVIKVTREDNECNRPLPPPNLVPCSPSQFTLVTSLLPLLPQSTTPKPPPTQQRAHEQIEEYQTMRAAGSDTDRVRRLSDAAAQDLSRPDLALARLIDSVGAVNRYVKYAGLGSLEAWPPPTTADGCITRPLREPSLRPASHEARCHRHYHHPRQFSPAPVVASRSIPPPNPTHAPPQVLHRRDERQGRRHA